MMSDSPQKLGRNEWNAYMDKVKAKDREALRSYSVLCTQAKTVCLQARW